MKLWLFWLAPIVGAIFVGVVYRWFETDDNDWGGAGPGEFESDSNTAL